MRSLTALMAAAALVFGLSAGAAPAIAADSGPSGSSWETKAPELGKARAAIEKKDYKAAVPLLEAAVAKIPDSADAWNLMGYAHRKLGLTDKALKYYDRALAIDPDHRGALEYLGELYLETGKPEEAKKMLARLDKVCFFGCAEYTDLKNALKAAKVIN
jgi:tetratricopeptide (TPR) repeat protein